MSGPPPRTPSAPVSSWLLLPCCSAPKRLKPLTACGRGAGVSSGCLNQPGPRPEGGTPAQPAALHS